MITHSMNEEYPADEQKGFLYREKAANTGDGLAEFNLAVTLLEEGKRNNPERAYSLFLSSAKKNIPNSLFYLGVLHSQKETYIDQITSYAWMHLFVNWRPDEDVRGMIGSANQNAIEIGNQFLEILKGELTAEEIDEALKLSKTLLN